MNCPACGDWRFPWVPCCYHPGEYEKKEKLLQKAKLYIPKEKKVEQKMTKEEHDALTGTCQTAPRTDFSWMLRNLKEGSRASRTGWNGRDMWIELQKPDTNSKMTRPYIYMKTVNDEFVPWVASQTDILADDWNLLPV